MSVEAKIKVIHTRVPKTCICPYCALKQSFKQNGKYFKMVKDINLKEPIRLKVEVLRAKCLNPACGKRYFIILPKGIGKYQRATKGLIDESIAGIIEDNSTTPRIAKRLNRIFNTTGFRSAIDRWKHKEADKLDLKEIIAELNFSGILCIDEYKPKRSKGYDLIDSDAKTGRFLYLEKAYGLGRGIVKEHFQTIETLGITPWAIIFDMRACFPKAAKSVFGRDILIQHDYFHVKKIIHFHLNRAMAEYRKTLKEQGLDTLDLWEAKWIILKNMEDWSIEEHRIIEDILSCYQRTIIEDILILKQKIRDIFLESKSRKEAFERREHLLSESWHLKTIHFANIIKFLNSPYFKFMTTYLDYPEIPKSGNSESVVRTWRLAVRRGEGEIWF